jgi:hypothetical protein
VTYLELVQRLWEESGSGGPRPSAVAGQQGEALRLVNWIARADRAIQNIHSDWDFLWTTGTINTVIGTSLYAFPTDCGSVDEDTFLIGGDEPLEVVDHLDVKGEVRDTNSGKPYRVIMQPNRQFRLESVPDAVYSITYDYFVKSVAMPVADGSVSIIPEEFHDAIVGKAIMYYATYENAEEALRNGAIMYEDNMDALESRYLPGKRDMHKQAEGNHFGVTVE